ncbi:MAG: hypothetical protein HKN91_08710 [Acidimicrobiia bacterium]|nr:hypothetical protein [Acidimicrobiia bacterium]
MGQKIEVASTVVEDIAMFDTDRGITGQDGVSFSSGQEIAADDFPALLADRLFQDVPGIDHVFVASNQVVVRRPHGWDEDVVATAAGVISNFFLFYPDDTAG